MEHSKPSLTGIVHLKDLINNEDYRYQDNFYVELEPSLKKEMFEVIIKESKTISNLAKEINVSFTRLWDQLTRVTLSIEILNKISRYLKKYKKFSLENLEKSIRSIKSSGSTSQKLYYPKFPINLKTVEGMRVISHLYHDGCISASNNKQPFYVNQSKNEVLQFLEDSKKIFGEFDRSIKEGFGHGAIKKKLFIIHLPTVIGKILIKAGFIPGDKTKNNPPVFEFLSRINEPDLISEYIAKAFNDEGTVSNRGVTLPQASLIKNKPQPSNILILDKLLLEKIGIKVNGPRLNKIYPNKDGLAATYVIGLYSKENLKKFNEKVKLIARKRIRLENYLYSVRAGKFTTRTDVLSS